MPNSAASDAGRATRRDGWAATKAGGRLRIHAVSKVFESELKFGEKQYTPALEDINVDIKEGEFVSVIGPSGSGKSTLLSIVAGLTDQTSGRVLLEDREVNRPGLDRGVVFQEFALFPWLTVRSNIKVGMDKKRLSSQEQNAIVDRLISLVALEGFDDYRPNRLSGGMKQRVAIARALACDPEVLLMDEPFGALDAQTRGAMQVQFEEIWQQSKKTVMFVTHSVREAVLLSDRAVVLSAHPGRVYKEITIDLDRPRQPSSPEFGEVEDIVNTALIEASGRDANSRAFTE